MSENLKEFSVVPIVLFPSEKNEKSAKFLDLDLKVYRQGFQEFVRGIHKITGDVLITSPNDFDGVNEFLEEMSENVGN